MAATTEEKLAWANRARESLRLYRDTAKMHSDYASPDRHYVYSYLICDLMHAMELDDIDPAEVLNEAIALHAVDSSPDYVGENDTTNGNDQ